MWTFSLFLEYLLAAQFDYAGLPEPGNMMHPFLPVIPDMPDDIDLANHPLVGAWTWDYNDEWQFVFNADGTGSRGLARAMTEFTWTADDFNLLITMDGSDTTEVWNLFMPEDDVLEMIFQWRSFFYTRVS